MSDKYSEMISGIIYHIGGKSNVKDLNHCQTRLRFILSDYGQVNVDALKSIDGVLNVVISGGQCQVVIGAHVKKVFDEINSKYTLSGSPAPDDKQQKSNDGIFSKAIDFVTGTFSPMIPAIAGAGMVKALLAVILVAGIITRESQSYFVINFMSDTVFYFLPILLAYSAATKLRCNPVLAAVMGGILLHPSFSQLRIAGDPVEVFSLPIRLVNYGSSVVPILLIVWLQSYVERFLNRWIPDSIKIIFVPMLTLFSVGIIGLTLLGPMGGFVGDYIAQAFSGLQSFGGWTVVFLVATFWPILVMFGIHYSIGPLSLAQLTTLKVENIIGPGAMIANITQGVAALIVGMRTKDNTVKQIARTSGITALMGITEPALYGVNLPKKYPLIAGMIGAACGGLYAGFTNVYRYAIGASGLPALPLYIGGDMWNLYNILIALVIAVTITSVLTYTLSFKYETSTINETQKEKKELKGTLVQSTADQEIVASPLTGKIIPLTEVSDEVFASGTLGKGLAIEPGEGKLVAPFDATVISLFPTKHAICLETDSGIELLIHVGIDTVSLNGEPFKSYIEEGQRVKAGQLMLEFDIDAIRKAGLSLQTPLIFTNLTESSAIQYLHGNTVAVGMNEKIMAIAL